MPDQEEEKKYGQLRGDGGPDLPLPILETEDSCVYPNRQAAEEELLEAAEQKFGNCSRTVRIVSSQEDRTRQ